MRLSCLRGVVLAAVSLFLLAGCNGAKLEPIYSGGASITLNDLPIYPAHEPVSGVFIQQIDHPVDGSTSSLGTFAQRYFLVKDFATQGDASPVLFYLCGEAPCDPGYAYLMDDTAKALGANIVVLEHRYYGGSVPFPDESLEHMKYLTIHNALEDAATFERWAQANLGLKGKWIVAGGSYPGMLAAYYRQKHPELVVGAWASSAPVNVVRDFPGYDATVATALGPSCLKLLRTALTQAGAIYDDPEQRRAFYVALGSDPDAPGLADIDRASFVSWISYQAETDAQYGHQGQLCQALQQNASNPIQGMIYYWNPPLAPDAPVEDAGVVEGQDGGAVIGVDGGVAPRFSPLSRNRPTLDSRHVPLPFMAQAHAPETLSSFQGNEWFYQVCTEVGFYQIANSDPTLSVQVAAYNTPEILNDQCLTFVGMSPAIAATSAAYYLPLVQGQASNILFVNGELDPWSTLSFKDPNAMPRGTTGFVVAGGSHCSDQGNLDRNDPIGVFQAHKLFFNLATQWLAGSGN